MVRERLRSNNLTAILDATSAGLGVAIVPLYLAMPALVSGRGGAHHADRRAARAGDPRGVPLAAKLVPPKVQAFVSFIQEKFRGQWWERYRPKAAA